MRAFVVAGLVLLHSAMVFAPLDWFVENEQTNVGFAIFVLWSALWGMPLLFLVSGIGIRFALRTRTPGAFVRERLKRLLVPYLVAVIALVPPMFYLGAKDDPRFTDTYGEFLLRFLDVRRILPHLPALNEWTLSNGHDADPGHAWFLYYLLVYSLLLLPVFLWLRRGIGARVLDRAGAAMRHRGAVLLLAAPISVVEALLRSDDNTGGWNRGAYAFLLLYGFLIASDHRFEEVLRRHRHVALTVGLLASSIVVFWAGALDEADLDPLRDGGICLAWRSLKGVAGWLLVVAIMGYASSVMAKRRATTTHATTSTRMSRLARYAHEAVLPYYVLHETVIVVIAYWLVRWQLDMVVKYFVLVLTSLAATLALYEFGVRRFRVTRFLFGMKGGRRPAGVAHR